MNILHVLPSLDLAYGGPLRAVIDLSLRGDTHGLSSEILGFGENGIGSSGFSSEAIHSLNYQWPRNYVYSPQIKSWFQANLRRFDGVVIHGVWLYPNWATRRACLDAGIPYACFPHGMLDPWPVFGQGFKKRIKKQTYWLLRERWIFNNCRCIFFTTARERRLASETFDIPPSHRLVVPYGVDSHAQRIDIPPRREIMFGPATRNALFLGRLHPKKNVHFLIEAWLKAMLPSRWKLTIAGPCEPEYLARLKTLAASSPLGKNISFVGPVHGSDKAYLFQNADWFLLPSLQENFGIAVLEAISHGCPVAISDQVYLADDLHDESEVLPLNLEAWVEFFRDRMSDDDWRNHLRERDEESLWPKFSMENIAQSWARTLTEVFSPDFLSGPSTLGFGTHVHSRS